MTLADAIAVCKTKAQDKSLTDAERQWHARLADWLAELKYRREMVKCRTGRVFSSPSTNC